jgi:hypothetical protein
MGNFIYTNSESEIVKNKQLIAQLQQDNKTLNICLKATRQSLEESNNEIKSLLAQIVQNKKRKEEMKEKSKQLIHEFVQDLLKNDKVNIKGLPDCIEKKIYENILNMLIGTLDKVLESTDIKLLNHRIIFDIVPE